MTAAMGLSRDATSLRRIRNAVIGSRTRKSEVVAAGHVPSLVTYLSSDPSIKSIEDSAEIVNLSATILASLANGAPAPTLLALLRGDAPRALLAAISALPSPPPMAQLEALLRALRSLLVAVAEHVSPGGRSRPSPRAYSARERGGWALAGDGGVSASASLSPAQEVCLRSRQAIALVFEPTSLPLWLGALFLAPLPLRAPAHSVAAPRIATSDVRHNSAGRSSSSSTRLTAHASTSSVRHSSGLREQVSAADSPAASSAGSDYGFLASSTASLPVGGASAPRTRPPAPNARVLAITEMVASIIAACLCVAGPGEVSSDASASASTATLSPSVQAELTARRARVLDFHAASASAPDSASAANDAMDVDQETSPRAATMPLAEEPILAHPQPLHARVVQRAKSVERATPLGSGTSSEMSSPSRSPIPPGGGADIAPSRGTLAVLLEAAECGFAKTQEAALWALAEMARENKQTSLRLFSCTTPAGLMPTSMLLNLRKETSPVVRLAAFSCLAHIIKLHAFSPRTHECVLSVLIDLIDEPGEVQISAAFALARLVADDTDLQILAVDHYDVIRRLGALLEKTQHVNAVSVDMPPGAPNDDLLVRLREATLTALAALTFQRDEIRRTLVDSTSPALLPLIVPSLSAGDLGIRIAACRLVRALSRSISILRTSLVDAGVAEKLISILKDDSEDAEVKQEATATICNLVLKFSPVKQLLVEGGGVGKLVELAREPAGPTRLNALWALKNILYSSETHTKQSVMEALGWDYVAKLAADEEALDEKAQEQALSIIRNLASSREADIELTLSGFGKDRLLDVIEGVVWQRRSESIMEQAAYVLVNVATGTETHRRAIIDRPNLCDALVYLLNHPSPDVCAASIWAGLNLTERAPRSAGSDIAAYALDRLRSFDYDKRLRPLVDDQEHDVADRARKLLARFDA